MIRPVPNPVTGAGTPGKIPKLTQTTVIGDSRITDTGPNVDIAAPLVIDDGLTIGATSVAGEGGEIELQGQGAHVGWNFDNFFDTLRWFTGGVIKMSLDALGALSVNSLLIGVDTAIDAAAVNLRIAADVTWSVIELWAVGAARWLVTSTEFRPFVDDSYHIGTTTKRPKNVFLSGNVIGEKGTLDNSTPMAAFAAAQTDIVGMAFTMVPGETWEVDIVIALTMVGVTGVKFYFQGVAGFGGWYVREGNAAGPLTWQAHFNAGIGVPGAPFYCTAAGAGVVRMRATLTSGAGTGTIKLVGITAGAGITCAVQSVNMLAKRIS